MTNPPKYHPASFEKHSLLSNFVDSYKKSELHISASIPEQAVKKYATIPFLQAPDKLQYFPRKEIKDTMLHCNPEDFKNFKPIECGLNDFWGIPSHQIKVEQQGPIEYDMKGVTDSDMMVMRMQNEQGTDNKLSQVLEEKAMPTSFDAYLGSLESNIKEKYTKIRKQTKTTKTAEEVAFEEYGKLTENDPSALLEKNKRGKRLKIARGLRNHAINLSENDELEKVVAPIRERRARRATKIPVQPPILASTPEISRVASEDSHSGLDYNVSSVRDEVERIESGDTDALAYYKKKLESGNGRANFTTSLGNDNEKIEELTKILKEKGVTQASILAARSTNQMLKLINKQDPYYFTPKKAPRQRKKKTE